MRIDSLPARPVQGLLLEDPLDHTLGDLLAEAARRFPGRPALLGTRRSLTWRELDEEVDRLAQLLLSLGVQPGEPVGLLCDKRPEVVTTFLACARMGAVLTPVNFKLHPDHLRDQFRSIGVRAVLAQRGFEELLARLRPEMRGGGVVVGLDGLEGDAAYEELSRQPARRPDFQPTPGTVCYYNYTSGTTGRPKGAITTHRNVLVNALASVEGLGFTAEDVFMGMFSVFSHPHELFHRSLLLGGSFVVVDTLSPRITLETIQRFGVTWMMAVPSFYEMMRDRGDIERYDTSSLRVLEAGGAYVSADTLERMEDYFGAHFVPVWGSTETTGVALALPPGPERRPGATGRPLPRYEVRLVDEAGGEPPPGEVGQMLVRSEAVAAGYQNRPEETARHFRDGWYYTGDLLRLDERGDLHFVGRMSEMLKVGGIRVYPLELEKVIAQHPEVEEVVVVGHYDRLRGEVPRAVVKARPGSSLDARALKAWCRERLAVYQLPRIIEFWAEIPRLPNGKVDKRRVAATPADPRRHDGR